MNNNTTILKNVIRQMNEELDRNIIRGVVYDSNNRICASETYTLMKFGNNYMLRHISFRNDRSINHATWYLLESRKNCTLTYREITEWAETPGARNVIVTRVRRNY